MYLMTLFLKSRCYFPFFENISKYNLHFRSNLSKCKHSLSLVPFNPHLNQLQCHLLFSLQLMIVTMLFQPLPIHSYFLAGTNSFIQWFFECLTWAVSLPLAFPAPFHSDPLPSCAYLKYQFQHNPFVYIALIPLLTWDFLHQHFSISIITLW